MGRKKVQDEIENLEPELEEAMEAEALEAADDSEEETEVEAAEDSDEEEVEIKKPARKPRARKPRAPKKTEEPSLLAGMSKTIEEEAAEENAEEVVVEVAAEAEAEEKPKAARGRKKADKEEEKEIEVVAKPWAAVNEISASISSNLERVNQMLREIPQQELFKPAVAKPAAITKVAVGMSFFAIVLSFVSLLLSQSARQVALEQITPAAAIVHSVPTAPSEPKQLALEVTPKRKLQRASRKAGH